MNDECVDAKIQQHPSFPAGLPDPIWAAALPVNWDRPVDQLLQDFSKDHTLMVTVCSHMHLPLLGGVSVGLPCPELQDLRHARGASVSCV